MRVCMFARSLPAHAVGGMELHIQTLAETLQKKGVEVSIITTAHPDGTAFEDKNGVKIHYLPGAPSGRYTRKWWLLSTEKFRELHSAEKFDLVHSQSSGAYYFLRKNLNREYGLPVVASLHGTSIDEIKTKLRLGFDIRKLGVLKNLYTYIFRDRFFISQCDAIIATSDSQVGVIEKYFPVAKEKITRVYNGIDADSFAPAKPKDSLYMSLNIRPTDTILLSIARLKKEKGVQNVLSVFPDILKGWPDAKLIVIGDGEYKQALIELAKALKIESNVRFLGSVAYDLLSGYFNLCNIFVNSTIRENGYDLTILQGMSCAKPVVVSDIKSVFSVIKSGENGYIYPRNDLAALKGAITEILCDKERSARVALKARETVLEKFSLNSMAEGTIKVYKKVSNG